ncbi:MAG TPA: hypothetical protein PK907_02330 [Candidatus Sabulitectum sp.]|nr:hypothetical protein [Candidatus Sabulitectum sp.]
MFLAIIILAVAEMTDVPVDEFLPEVEMDWEWLTYCSGTPGWISWAGTYRGTWFHLEDFYPGVSETALSASEFWFYHHSSYPWDTSDAYIELWAGEENGPAAQIRQDIATAVHFAPVYVICEPPETVPGDFWVLVNTEMSAGGWPSLLGDDSSQPVNHSFFSDDFIVWEPWFGRNLFIAVLADVDAISSTSWGCLKTLF